MRDFVSGFATGFAGGVTQGAKIGLAARELRDKRESDAATLARQIAADQATAEYRKGQLALGGRNATTAEKRLGIAQGALTETGKHNRATESTNAGNAAGLERLRKAQIEKLGGNKAGLNAYLAGQGLTPPGGTGAVATPPAVTTPLTPDASTPDDGEADKSISTVEQFDAIGAILDGPDADPDDEENQ